MNTHRRERTAPNPFGAAQVQPGAVPYLFPAGQSAAALIEKLRAQGWWGEVVGEEGTGKSTLLAALVPELRAAGREPVPIRLRVGQRRLPALDGPLCPGRTQLVIDSYEQLSGWQRWRVRWMCQRHAYGLLVTTHRPAGLPLLYHTCVSEATARQVVEYLTAAGEKMVQPAEVGEYLAARGGNLRQALFDLYDLFETRRPWPPPQSPTG